MKLFPDEYPCYHPCELLTTFPSLFFTCRCEFANLLGWLVASVNTSATGGSGAEESVQKLCSLALDTFETASLALYNHPNSLVYAKLREFMTVEGYYLEQTPCGVCNAQASPYSQLKMVRSLSFALFSTILFLCCPQ